MSITNEICDLWNFDGNFNINWMNVLIMGLFAAMLISALYAMINHGHVQSIGPDIYFDGVTYQWEVPRGSPWIGVLPDGSVGTLQPYGGISAV